ncbi:hypothetical protein C8J56DRAFT_1102153 [Mycena floridula]|nr:hypothetical protein C8J56DRAFT_1102153 [Mycena floridula]
MFGLGIEEGPRLPMEIFDQICDDIVEPAELKILSGVSSSFRLKAQKRLFAESVTFAFANLEEDPARPDIVSRNQSAAFPRDFGSYRYTAGDNWVAIELYYSTLHQYLSALSSFPNLYHLSLSNVDITDEVCQYLTHIPKLSSLSLTDCYVFVTGNFDLNLSSFSFNLQNEDIEVDGTIAIEIFSPRNLMSLSLDTPVSCLDYVTNNISAFHLRLTHLSIDPYLISEKHVYHLLGGCPDLLSLTLTNTPMSSPSDLP